MKPKLCLVQTAVFLTLSVARLGAFSLLGPYASWMDQTLAYKQPGDIGGPMDINEEYRWNVPVVTYAFDQSFLDYFGSNGVAAVERAIGVINALPPASGMDLTNFPLATRLYNYLAGAQDQYDLKTATLGLLLEQMGLAPPIRNVFALRRFDWLFFCPAPGLYFLDEMTWPPGTIPQYVIERAFDPETLATSHYVNGVLFSSYIAVYGAPPSRVDFVEAREFPIDIPELALPYVPVAEAGWAPGVYCQGLTQDDVGGLRYLLASNNVNYEVLLPDVHGAATNAASFVNGALRPGIEKLTFVRQDYDSALGWTTPITNEFTDTYFINGMTMHQELQREIVEPDFLFCATNAGDYWSRNPRCERTGTMDWWNSAPATGSTNSGPGTIRPPIRIVFGKSVRYYATGSMYGAGTGGPFWASFDDTTNAPIAYPCPTAQPETPMRLRWHFPSSSLAHYEWQLPLPLGGQVALQSSTNLTDWVSYMIATNEGMRIEWFHEVSPGSKRYFRIVPQ
jgi:hypothetical protein